VTGAPKLLRPDLRRLMKPDSCVQLCMLVQVDLFDTRRRRLSLNHATLERDIPSGMALASGYHFRFANCDSKSFGRKIGIAI